MMERWCKHFHGTREPCAKGVDIRGLVGGTDLGWATRTPCREKHGVNTCVKREWPTEEEVAEYDKQVQLHATKTAEAIRQIRAKHKCDPARSGAAGTITCPACAGVLHYTIAAGNGHVWGSCEKKDCIGWMM